MVVGLGLLLVLLLPALDGRLLGRLVELERL